MSTDAPPSPKPSPVEPSNVTPPPKSTAINPEPVTPKPTVVEEKKSISTPTPVATPAPVPSPKPAPTTPVATTAATTKVKCVKCGKDVTAKFCTGCGTPAALSVLSTTPASEPVTAAKPSATPIAPTPAPSTPVVEHKPVVQSPAPQPRQEERISTDDVINVMMFH